MPLQYDIVLVGGGLQAGLLALALLHRHPTARIALVERGARLAGNHTWCFHAADLPEEARAFVDDLVVARWPAYEVRFPGLSRRVEQPYAALSSERFARVVRDRVLACRGCDLFLGCEVLWTNGPPERADTASSPHRLQTVRLADGRSLAAPVVIDCRGPGAVGDTSRCGWQKFHGVEVELERPVAPEVPLLMDATVPQSDGFCFLYLLPFSPTRLLAEDTSFSDGPALDVDARRDFVLRALERRRLPVAAVVREESGVLPMPWSGAGPRAGRPLRAGYAGGWFHPATGYSFPAALRLALAVASVAPGEPLDAAVAPLRRALARQARFGRQLNWLLFRLMRPEERWRALARFYRLPAPTIERFYAMRTTAADRARLVVGRPPGGLTFRNLTGARSA